MPHTGCLCQISPIFNVANYDVVLMSSVTYYFEDIKTAQRLRLVRLLNDRKVSTKTKKEVLAELRNRAMSDNEIKCVVSNELRQFRKDNE